jgi:hypothetical protein
MKRLVEFLKTTLLGGALVVLPAWLTVLLLLKALMQLQGIVKPVGAVLPESVGHPRVMAVLTLLAVCFAVGALIRAAIGRQVVERTVLERLPGYATLRSVAEQLGDMEKAHGFKPALVEFGTHAGGGDDLHHRRRPGASGRRAAPHGLQGRNQMGYGRRRDARGDAPGPRLSHR